MYFIKKKKEEVVDYTVQDKTHRMKSTDVT